MQKRMLRILISVAALGILLLGSALYLHAGAGSGTAKAQSYVLKPERRSKERILSGFASSELDPQASTNAKTNTTQKLGNYFPTSDDGCSQNLGGNIKVNQNCLNVSDPTLQGRGQAQMKLLSLKTLYIPTILSLPLTIIGEEMAIVIVNSVVIMDSWTDSTIPMGFTSGASFGGVARQYWQSGGDPSVVRGIQKVTPIRTVKSS